MKVVRGEIDRGHLCVGDAYPRRVTTRIDFRSHVEARATLRAADQADNGREADEGIPRQFIAMCENKRYSIRFHLLVPGGK